MKGVHIFLADGFEDVEALATFDVLKRGGVDVKLVGVGDDPFVVSSHGITVGVENTLREMIAFGTGQGAGMSHRCTDSRDVMIFPGGMPGSKNLASNRELVRLMKEHYATGGTLAAICAAPGLVLGQLDGLEGVHFTCFDGFEDGPLAKGAVFDPQPAVRCGRIITGRSAGHAIAFALEILGALKGADAVEKVKYAMFL